MIFPDKFQLENKIAVITGGAGLIGTAICHALSEAGGKGFIGGIGGGRGGGVCGGVQAKGF